MMKMTMVKLMSKTINVFVLFSVLSVLSACQQNTKQTANETQKSAQQQSWKLNPEYSSISIITTKNNSNAEVSNFTAFSGNISADGQLSISIDMNSLETNIPIRNERIQEHLFQTDIYQTADINAQLKPEDLTVGVHNISFDVDLHGLSAIMDAEFMVFEQQGNKVVTLHKPLIIKAETFGLENGINTLKNLAKLQSIDYTVPLNLILNFQAQ